MEIVEFLDNTKKQNRHTVLIFGLGLIGSSILKKISKQQVYNFRHFPFSWNLKNRQIDELEIILNYLKKNKSNKYIDIIWSAGKAGFFSDIEEINLELKSYLRVLAFAKNLSIEFSNSNLKFHLFSSAGGLFEGQSIVSFDSSPRPFRPYGQLKLSQEKLLFDFSKHFNYRIYRPSTVYGYYPNARIGLISNILIKAIRNEFIEIFALRTSLRDYIFVEDISDFVIDIIIKNLDNINHNFFLVSGKPTSIDEIVSKSIDVTKKNLYHSYNLNYKNSLDTTFSMKLVPDGLKLSTLSIGLDKTYKELLNYNNSINI